MNKLVARLGFGAALVSLLSFFVYIISFICIALNAPIFIWTNLAKFAEYNSQYNQIFKHIAMIFMLIYCICYVIEMVCLEEWVEQSKRVLAKLAVLFGLGFAILTGINYFIQITSVRFQVQTGKIGGLEQFIMSYPISAVAAINMLGWTVFLGISSLCIAFCFGKSKTENLCKYSFLANALFMLVASAGYIADINVIVFVCMYVGLGGTMLATALSLCRLFNNMN